MRTLNRPRSDITTFAEPDSAVAAMHEGFGLQARGCPKRIV